jgi:CBS domain containing-hemolysin-like protein
VIQEFVVNIVFILLLVLANGFFVAAEFAIVKVRSTQFAQRVKQGDRRAWLAQNIVDHLNAYLSATQLGSTLTSLGLGWVGEPLLAHFFHQPFISMGVTSESTIQAISFGLSFGLLTFLHIILGELAPKYFALQHAEATALIVSLPLQLFYNVFRPVIWLINRSANVLLRSVGIPAAGPSEMLHSAEELQLMVSEGTKSGLFNKTEQELISSIFEFSNSTAKEIMVPRTEVIGVEVGTPRDKLIRIVTEEGYSRIPVYKDSIDNIVGVVYTKDLINLLEHRDLIVLQDIIRQAYFVPDAIKISQLMRDMQERKLHMAIVVDEFGGTQGIITMEDILEEIVGEIHDEYDEVLKDVEQSADGSALVNARMNIDDFNKRFAVDVPEDPEYETLNGFLHKITGRIPEIQEEIRYNNLHFTIMKKSQRRVRQVKVRKMTPSSPTVNN